MERHGVHPSVGPSMGPQQETRCCRFAAVGPADRRYRPIVGSTARSSKRGQWRPRCRRGSTDLFCFYRAMLCIRGSKPWACVCPSVYLAVTSRCSIETAERIELVYGM